MKPEPGKPLHRIYGVIRATMMLLLALASLPVIAVNNVHLYGALVAEPCVILPGDQEIQLDFGTIVDKYLYLNTRTLGQSFDIHLSECDISLTTTVSISFRGTESQALPGLLAVNDGSKAKGIAIGFETPESKPLPINKMSEKSTLQAGNNRISLKAYVQGEPEAISRKSIALEPFSAIATFSLEYQ